MKKAICNLICKLTFNKVCLKWCDTKCCSENKKRKRKKRKK